MTRLGGRATRGAIAIAASLAVAGCAPSPAQGEAGLTIFAAASLTESFTELADAFSADHGDIDVAPLSFDGSSTLATQLVEGARADVFASADERTMSVVDDAGLLAGPASVFATNVLEIAVAPGNPHGIRSLADLASEGLAVVLCAPAVPCGAAAQRLLDLHSVGVTPASEEQNVTAVLTKVRLGEADAGLVYATDVRAAGGTVDGVAIPNADEAVNEYLIAALADAPHPGPAAEFVAWVRSDAAQTVLRRHGFGAP